MIKNLCVVKSELLRRNGCFKKKINARKRQRSFGRKVYVWVRLIGVLVSRSVSAPQAGEVGSFVRGASVA